MPRLNCSASFQGLLPLLLLACNVHAQSSGALLVEQADSLYRAGAYEASAERFAEAFAATDSTESNTYYIAATAAALAGQAGRAFSFLHRAVEVGWDNAPAWEVDGDFEALRAYPALWGELMAALLRRRTAVAPPTFDVRLAVALDSIHVLDQRGRREWRRIWRAHPEGIPDSVRAEFWDRQKPIDQANLVFLDAVVAERGWPSISTVGTQGATGAFLIVQHAELEDQERYRPLLEAAVAAGEAEAWHLAYLTDRVLIRRGGPQRYGTQPNAPVEDEANLNARRAQLDLDPLER
ncbi:MAG: DUF6624 domain-containing protein [Bacteroidota bacterium]